MEPWEVTAVSCASISHLSNGDDGNAIYSTDSLQIKCVNMCEVVEYPYMLGVVICLQNQGSAWLHSQTWQPPGAELQPQMRREVEASTWVNPSLCCWRTSSWERADRSDPHCPGPGVQQPPEVLQAALASDLELAVEEIEAL